MLDKEEGDIDCYALRMKKLAKNPFQLKKEWTLSMKYESACQQVFL
jgi:hypothetical protein